MFSAYDGPPSPGRAAASIVSRFAYSFADEIDALPQQKPPTELSVSFAGESSSFAAAPAYAAMPLPTGDEAQQHQPLEIPKTPSHTRREPGRIYHEEVELRRVISMAGAAELELHHLVRVPHRRDCVRAL